MSLAGQTAIITGGSKGLERAICLCTKYAIPPIRNSKNGTIIISSSEAGLHGIPQLSVYCTSKFGVNGITESIAS
jgi:3-oxoacyl-[acyl-carrier protein] reductase